MAEDPFASIAQPVSATPAADPFASIAQPEQPVTPATFKAKDEQGVPILRSQWDATKYELGEAAKGIGDVAVGTVQAFDPRRKEGENAFTQLPFVRMGKAAIEPLTHVGEIPGAIKDIADSPSPLHALATVSPRAGGQGIGTYLTGKAAEYGTKAATPGEFRGRVQPFVRKFTNVESALKDEVKGTAEKQGTALENNKAERRDIFKENMRKQSQANFEIGRDKVRIAEQNRKIEAQNTGQEGALAKRKIAEQLVDQQSLKLREHLGNVEESVGKEANAKFDEVRKIVGNPEIEPQALTDAVKTAEKEDLQGIPENIKEFRSILGHGEELSEEMQKQYEEVTGQPYEGPEPMSWDKLQSLKSRIDARLRSAGRVRMNGDLKRALYRVQNTIVDTMGEMAEEHGAGDKWQEARQFWRQYKEDFHEPTGPSGSGSPVAAALDAVDPKNIRQPFVLKQSTAGNRALDILRKYPQHGGTNAASLAEQMLKDHETMRSLPSKVTPKPLKEPKQVHDMPARKPAPPVPETPVIDARQVARDAIAKSARNWGSFNARDIGILGSSVLAGTITHLLGGSGLELPVAALSYEGAKFSASRLLNRPAVVEWLSKTPPEEAAALAKIPGADKVKIMDGLTQIATRTGRPVTLSPAAKQLLGPANVAKIVAAGGAAGASQIKNRKDALDRLAPNQP